MKNWSNKIEKINQKSKQYNVWKLEQMINFGLDGEKIPKALLEKYLPILNIDETKKRYLKYLLSQ